MNMKPAALCTLLASSLLLGACASSPEPARTAATPPATRRRQPGALPRAQPAPRQRAAGPAAGRRRLRRGPGPGHHPGDQPAHARGDRHPRLRSRRCRRIRRARLPRAAGAEQRRLQPRRAGCLQRRDGQGRRALLHCGTGARAGQLYAAWLVRERGLSPQEAMQRVAPLGLWPLPMERLLGRPLTIDYAAPAGGDAPRPEAASAQGRRIASTAARRAGAVSGRS
ncbi:MAG: hypothetical protein KatS3mg127_1349 [Silanimonas sp.]|nr:MAG: hypothetical protein KatS3mg127_1349 [Silanimonas sp.]